MYEWCNELEIFKNNINDKLGQLNPTPGYVLTYININSLEHPVVINIVPEKLSGWRTPYSQKISIAVYYDTKMSFDIKRLCSNYIRNRRLTTFKDHDVLSIVIDRYTPTNHALHGWMSNSTISFINRMIDEPSIRPINRKKMNLVSEIIDQLITIHEFEFINNLKDN